EQGRSDGTVDLCEKRGGRKAASAWARLDINPSLHLPRYVAQTDVTAPFVDSLSSSPCNFARKPTSSGRDTPSAATSFRAASTRDTNSSCSHLQSRSMAGSSCISAGRKVST